MLSNAGTILPYDQALVDKLRSELNINEKLCRILTQGASAAMRWPGIISGHSWINCTVPG